MSKKNKLFISQPMNGKTDEEILSERVIALFNAELFLEEEVELLNSFFQYAPVNAKPLWFLAKSIELMSTADIVYFAKGWRNARGCVIEHMCAEQYGLRILEEQ